MIRGLTTEEAQQLLHKHGPNVLPKAAPAPLWWRFTSQFQSPLIYLLVFAFAFDLALWVCEGTRGWPIEALAISAILLLNAGLGTFQEYRSEQALAQLELLAAPLAWVIRDGNLVRLPNRELMPGDVVRAQAGERVPAELATMLGTIPVQKTPLERRLEVLGRQIARWVGGLALALAALGIAAEGMGQFGQIVFFAIALAVAAVPEGMPAVVTLTLALGVQRIQGLLSYVRSQGLDVAATRHARSRWPTKAIAC